MSKWTEDTTVQFVKLYLKHDCLWNIRSSNYRNRQAKQTGLANIVATMAPIIGITNFGVKEVESKIKSIRSTYSQEIKKIKDSLKSGAGTDEIYKPSVKWFDILHQTINSVNISQARKTQNNLEINEENSGENSIDKTNDSEINQLASTSEQQLTIPNYNNATRKRRIQELHSLVDKVNSINPSPSTTEHEFDQFAKSIAGQLKTMPLLLALQAQKYIQNYLSDVRIQQLMNSSRTNSSIYSSTISTPPPSSNTYYVESPQHSPSWISENRQTFSAEPVTTIPQSDTQITLYSQAGDVAECIIGADILSQAITSIIDKK